ncbi:uncharacterized protein LOC121424803 isoform X2 [Lytechinus variegatus]|uniref:uncharacterized protein LOC121424803 isoform X2 n=1 Tax=Lytechinus variegatus TaxID=7654 RepID=UPI001BB14365|nr:uncharacterized protein LOC121424803 isoform X2 [Lytechinus variegatus]
MNEPKSPSTKETEHYRLIEESDGENEVDLLDEQEDATEEMENCTTQTGELEVLDTMETEHDKLMEESDEDNEVDLLDEQEDTVEETDRRRRKETLESNNESRNKEKAEEFDRDIRYEIDYFQEIAESMKVFASMMVDMKVVKVEIKGIKEMLKALAGKVECVIEGRAQNEQQRLREKRITGRMAKDNFLARKRKIMYGKGRRKIDSGKLVMNKNVVNGKRDEGERRQTVENTGRVFTKNTSGDGHREGVHERHGERIDAGRKIAEKNLVETRKDESWVMTQDSLGNPNSEDMNESGGEDKMIMEKILDEVRTNSMHDHATINNDGQNENCTGIESLQESDDEDVGTVDVLFDGGGDSEEDCSGVQDECAKSKDYNSTAKFEREKNDRSISRSRLSKQDDESFAQGVVNEEVAKPQEDFRWEKFPKRRIKGLRSLPIGRFALNIIKNLVRNDILMKSNCSGKHTATTSIPHVQAIDPGILEYALETTYKVFDVEEYEKHLVRRECVSAINAHCRYLRKVARSAPRKSTMEKGRMGADQEEWLPGNDSIACLPTAIAQVDERRLEEQVSVQSKKDEISEKKVLRKKMSVNSNGQTDGEDNPIGLLGIGKVKPGGEDGEVDIGRHDSATKSGEQDVSVIAGNGRQYGIEERTQKGLPWKKLTDKDISNFKSRLRSAPAFATHAIAHVISDRVLINSNCYGIKRINSGRPNVQPIDPDILAYVIETAFDAYGIDEQDQGKCRKECVRAIDSHCRYLFASSKTRKSECASGMQRNVMKQKDGECESGEEIGRKEESSVEISEKSERHV